MFIQDNLQKLKVSIDTNFPNTRFFFMFIGVLAAVPALYAIGALTSLWRSDLTLDLLFFALLVITGVSAGIMLFINKSYIRTPPSIN